MFSQKLRTETKGKLSSLCHAGCMESDVLRGFGSFSCRQFGGKFVRGRQGQGCTANARNGFIVTMDTVLAGNSMASWYGSGPGWWSFTQFVSSCKECWCHLKKQKRWMLVWNCTKKWMWYTRSTYVMESPRLYVAWHCDYWVSDPNRENYQA